MSQNFQGALRLFLLANPQVFALVGSNVFETPAPQAGNDPYVTIHQVSSVELNHIANPDQIVDERYQFDIYTLNYDQGESIYEAIRNALHFQNAVSFDSWYVYSILRQGRNVTHEPIRDASEDIYHRISVDFMIRRNLNPS